MSNLIAPGTYPAKCVDAALGESKAGNEQIGMGFQILGDGEFAGRVQFGFFSFADAAADYTFEKMRNAGWKGDDLSDLSSLCPSETECSIVVQHEPYEGKVQAKIAFVNKDSKVRMAAPLDDAKKRAFAARMKGKAIASRAGQRPTPATQPAQRRPPPANSGGHPFAPGGADFGPPIDDDVGF